jgi:hypothetical protein
MRSRKQVVAAVTLLTVLLIPGEAWVGTLVRHGDARKLPEAGSYCIAVVGHYTNRDQLTEAGVLTVKWASSRSIERQAQMLGLRSAFVDWFVNEWMRTGGSRGEALKQLQDIVDHYRNHPSLPEPQSGHPTSIEKCGGNQK